MNSDGEEICTCREYTDNEATGSDDELPSRDVDLSCYSISGGLNSNANSSTDTPTSRNNRNRKRKLTENRSSLISPELL